MSPYFSEHGTLGGIIYFLILQAVLSAFGGILAMTWWVWAILAIGFWIGARPDTRAIVITGWKFWTWQYDYDMYERTHFGDIYLWYLSRWWQVWTLPYLIHVWIDRGFHNGVDRKASWWFGEVLHLIVNGTIIVTILMVKNAI